MKNYLLVRHVDVSEVSGTGVVGEVAEFSDGTAVLRWHGEFPTTTVHERGIESILHIHGHGGLTELVEVTDGHESRTARGDGAGTPEPAGQSRHGV